jgi:hypothetical protein
LSAPFAWHRSSEVKWREAGSQRRDVVLSGGSNGHFEAGHDNAAHRPGERFRSGVRIHASHDSTFSFSAIRSTRLAQRKRQTPRNTVAAHLEITPRKIASVFLLMAQPPANKTITFDFSKEKNHEEDAGNCVDGSDRARFCRSGAGGECSMLRFSRLLCFLRRRVLEAV